MHGLNITLHEAPGRRAQAAAMTVMERAFDPAFGEAWTAAQLAGLVTMAGSWLRWPTMCTSLSEMGRRSIPSR